MKHPIEILEHYWKFSEFKPQQEAIIEAVLANEDCIALLPTGGGKSICFQIPALIKDGICIVVSPLIALMQDQVNNLKEKGIKAMALTSGYTYDDIDRMLDNCIYGNYKFLYLSPERLQQDLVQERIKQMNVNVIAVDEAHCISQWGHDFRPAYRDIKTLRTLHPSVNVIGLTASATAKVVEDISTQLDCIAPQIFKTSFQRPNLAYLTLDCEDKYFKTVQILKKYAGTSIIYVRNRKATLEISGYLNKIGITSGYYHGGLSPKEKDTQFERWTANENQVMVATNAFGMGIDKANVQTVIHHNLPESLESYYQEAGRAGRNNENAYAVILRNTSDEKNSKSQYINGLPDIAFLKNVYKRLCNYFQISYGEGVDTVHNFNFKLFCSTYSLPSILTYNALKILDRTSIISLEERFKNTAFLQIIIGNTALFNYIEKHPKQALIIKVVLRSHEGVFDHSTEIFTQTIAKKINLSEDEVISHLTALNKAEIVQFESSKTDAQITFIEPREDDKTIHRISKIVSQQQDLKKAQLQSVFDYIKNDGICKSQKLLSYFEEIDSKQCGICSSCLERSKKSVISESDSKTILTLLKTDALSSRKLEALSTFNSEKLTTILTNLLEKELIELTERNTYKLKTS
ncbi:ATP-dependent DNA helicase RecQ [Formosa sp. Hel1_33_131]|jgi:ATP-dependent DNA helicase RecQ|uniref:RecQ family ATP-dependent DNA helicase n=1 Tax=Formosa sp. Hel1_33_131 TaxID=1336794 RepID=UPI00084E15B7|nr:RecQ family ATP-dependent DNA helicase [Formosa sp. Hel1_33_131]AOR29463.1 ATP-dependent DNA helicase RecQ [Formosa sp. Hel1_33_131]